jgi:hypothetical protein
MLGSWKGKQPQQMSVPFVLRRSEEETGKWLAFLIWPARERSFLNRLFNKSPSKRRVNSTLILDTDICLSRKREIFATRVSLSPARRGKARSYMLCLKLSFFILLSACLFVYLERPNNGPHTAGSHEYFIS